MTQIKNFAEAHKLLNQFVPEVPSKQKYSLDQMRDLMSQLGNPQDKIKVIHVAGTSGKTSTAYYVAALLGQTGKEVGLTVSPHVDEVNERVQVNLQPLPEQKFCEALGEFIDIVGKTGIKPTYFELLVAFAYWYFDKEKVDFAVVEVGLGGALDGTNVIHQPDKICVITDIGLDHIEVLGDTLEKIATQKAGIIKSHNPVFMYKQGADVMEQVTKRCRKSHAQLHEIAQQPQIAGTKDLPPFQQRNFYLAKSVAEYATGETFSAEQIHQVAQIIIPARMEVINFVGKTLVIDGSHNGQKMRAVRQGVDKLFPDQKIAALVSFVQSEHGRAEGALQELKNVTDNLIITAFSGEQDAPKHSIEPAKIANLAQRVGFHEIDVIEDPKSAFKKLLKRPEPVLLVTGSFYLLNHIRPLIMKK